MGLVRLNGFFASKHMCFIDQSGRDPPFRLDETRMRVTKYYVLPIRMEGDTGDLPSKSRN